MSRVRCVRGLQGSIGVWNKKKSSGSRELARRIPWK